MNRKITLPMLSIMCVFIAMGCRGQNRINNPTGRVSKAGNMSEWIKLSYGGGLGNDSGQHLIIYSNGKVHVKLGRPRANGYIGTFEMTLSAERRAELDAEVSRARFQSMADDYPPAKGTYDWERAVLTITQDAGQSKRVYVASTSPSYPRQLKRLFDLTDRMPEEIKTSGAPNGILSRLISEASAKPVAAISVRLELKKHRFKLGEKINCDFVIKNVGKSVVVLPSLNSREIAWGGISADLRHREDEIMNVDSTKISFGGEPSQPAASLTNRAIADLKNVVNIEPGKELRIPLQRPLAATSPGDYSIIGWFTIVLRYDRAALKKKLGEGLVDGFTGTKIVHLTIDK